MKNAIRFLLVSLAATLALQAAAEPAPQRLKRAQSFLGVHFDFHAGPDCTEIGRHTTREMIESIIDQVHPDYLQIDCKGHPGLSSYPTKVGHPAPGFVGDPLRLWREVTAARGVSLYMHYSGVWDSEAIRRHPDWAALNADGKPNGNATSFWSPYADQLLVPQLRELAGDYGIDGAWVDGECWASVPDYGPAALQAFYEATGLRDAPRKPADPHWSEFLQFNRDAFRRYLRHYIAAVKKTHPAFELCSNWAFTDHMPEPVTAPLDWLSGDYSPEDSVNSARLSARFLARQGRPWDLMAWSFTLKPGKNGSNQKTPLQLRQEAAVVLALGGGFQAYFSQNRDGSVRTERMPVMAEVAQFCRARQALCHHAQPVPQVALLLSTAGHYHQENGLFSRDYSRFTGTLQALLETQHSVEVLDEQQLAGRLDQYPLIVVPEWDYLDPQFRLDLLAYVRAGGNLLLVGPGPAALFLAELDATPLAATPPAPLCLQVRDGFLPLPGRVQPVKLGSSARLFGQLCLTNDPGSSAQPAASITPLGKGRIAALYFSFSRTYLAGRNPLAREFLLDLSRQLFPEPMIEVAGSPDVDVSLARKDGKLLVNLVNTAGPHRTVPIIDAIPPVGPLALTLRLPAQPARVTIEPGARPLAFEYRAGALHLTVPPVEIHDVVLVQTP